VVERRFHRLQRMAAVDTPPAAVAHRGPLERALGVTRESRRLDKRTAAVTDTPL
jgi:hypothetical protein